jgi:hypothetical protein
MVQADRAGLSVVQQCALLSISRSGFYNEPIGEDAETLALMRAIDEAYSKFPSYGSRQMLRHLVRQGLQVGRKRVRRLMARTGLTANYQKPRTSTPHPEHRVYPYLLRRGKAVEGVERTFAWLNRCRRLARDIKNKTRTALAFLKLASIRLMIRKLCHK